MRNLFYIIFYSILLLGLGRSNNTYAQVQGLVRSGTWNATTINATTSPSTTEPVVNITGNIKLTGTITVASGYTLTIVNNTEDSLTIKKTKSSSLFIVNKGGKLIIIGNKKGKIILDGGGNLQEIADTLKLGTKGISTSNGIQNNGSLEMRNVTIQNIFTTGMYSGAIKVGSYNGKTILDSCTIQKCQSGAGCAIMIQNTIKDNYISADICSVEISNSLIQKCITGGSATNNSGGAIRTLGQTVSSLYLTNTVFRNNYARRNRGWVDTLVKDGNGGAIFWNARGMDSTKCVIDGCIFENNKSDDNGGAIKSQGTIIFTNARTKKQTFIQNNTAPNGAGLYIEGYSGSNSTGKRDIVIDLNDNLVVQNNIAPAYDDPEGKLVGGKGAGVHFYFGTEMNLDKNSTVTIYLNGATISNNRTTGKNGIGGGIYFENTSKAAYNYEFYNYFNHGIVSQNTATSNGGGIYMYKGSVESQKITDSNSTLLVSNNEANEGAGIYIKDGSLLLYDGTIDNNRITGAGNGGGIYIEDGNFTIKGGAISNNTVAKGVGGGVYITGSISGTDTTGRFTMNGGEIIKNSAIDNCGGGVYLKGGKFVLDTGKIWHNSAEVDGGGVYLNSGNFELDFGQISHNTANENGGGVYLIGDNCTYKLKNGNILKNTAKLGGGVYLAKGDFILADNESDKGSIQGNCSTENGGGVYIAGSGSFTMNGGLIEGNGKDTVSNNVSTTNGGGVYLSGGVLTVNAGSIKANAVKNNGGGAYINGGSLSVTSGYIQKNTANIDGGGVYIINGSVNMGKGFIQENSCNRYGGGVCVYNSSEDESDTKEVSFLGGTVSNNSAKFGGGVCVDGKIRLATGNNIAIAENSATNGGGVCLMRNAHMTFGAGEIKNNKAVSDHNYTDTTAYKIDIENLEGIGGGVYLNTNTTLIFNAVDNLGLFGNTAKNGADELFANGNNTTVELPDVTTMKLKDYIGGSNLKWIEDYIVNDKKYDMGTFIKGADEWNDEKGKTNLRYRQMLEQNIQVLPQLTGGITESDPRSKKYICFALGYEIIYITLKVYGLHKNESLIFNVSQDGSDTDASNFQVIVTGNGSEFVSKQIAVTAGKWRITEDNWGYTYKITDKTGNNHPNDPMDVVDSTKRLFTFETEKKQGLPLNHETIIIRQMGNTGN